MTVIVSVYIYLDGILLWSNHLKLMNLWTICGKIVNACGNSCAMVCNMKPSVDFTIISFNSLTMICSWMLNKATSIIGPISQGEMIFWITDSDIWIGGKKTLAYDEYKWVFIIRWCFATKIHQNCVGGNLKMEKHSGMFLPITTHSSKPSKDISALINDYS